jgi:hypothetical protein
MEQDEAVEAGTAGPHEGGRIESASDADDETPSSTHIPPCAIILSAVARVRKTSAYCHACSRGAERAILRPRRAARIDWRPLKCGNLRTFDFIIESQFIAVARSESDDKRDRIVAGRMASFRSTR